MAYIGLIALGVEELVVHPAPPVKDVPNLKNTVSPPPRFPPKLHRHEDKPVVPSVYLDSNRNKKREEKANTGG